MLRQLAIQNVVLVERVELEFERGLGVLTGETGAGKSILLDALGLALGSRAETGLVRAGQEARQSPPSWIFSWIILSTHRFASRGSRWTRVSR